jgi:hypothetical protein
MCVCVTAGTPRRSGLDVCTPNDAHTVRTDGGESIAAQSLTFFNAVILTSAVAWFTCSGKQYEQQLEGSDVRGSLLWKH